jgi:hypothetical protein
LADLLSEYLKRGFTDIVSVDSSSKESGDWHGTERNHETIVAKRGTECFRATGYAIDEFGPGGQHSAEITSEQIITREEYDALAIGRQTMDTPKVRQEFNQREFGFQKAREVKGLLEAEAPICPIHEKPMKLRRGPNAYFFGCPRYQRQQCAEIKWLTPAQKALAKETPWLANVLD